MAVDGGYAKKPFLPAARPDGDTVVSRRRKDAALWSVPSPIRRDGQRGPLPTRAGQPQGWQQVECVPYGARLTKTYKTLLASWRAAGGLIRVVLVREEDHGIPFFGTDPQASVVDILAAAADRGALEQSNKDVQAVWGAGQQQLRKVHANVGAFNLKAWMHTVVEAWAWERSAEELVDRSRSPWHDPKRRPWHADKRKALHRQVLRQEIAAVLSGPPDTQRFRQLAEKLLDLAA